MQDQSLENLISSPNPLSSIISKSRKLAQYYPMFSNPQQIKYYSQIPQIQISLNNLETQISGLVKDIGNFIGYESQTKNNIKLATTTQIIDQYVDNIEIKIKKFQEQQQKIRIKQKHPDKVIQQIKPQKLWNLKPPTRVTQSNQFSYSTINYQDIVTPSKDIKTSTFTYVDTEDQFSVLLLKLSQQKQIAVDLEHSDKSYRGFTCLIQISTRTEDFIVDVFPLWNQINQLNQIFNNPDILKVFHGAYMDVKWLHRDFDIRITNLFDTFHASQHLKNQQNSYAYLLKHYCQVETNKKYQMADWRQRPLNEQMILYARIDTHYLLEIYDKMKADIISQAINNKMDVKEALNSVFSNSKDVTQTTYNESNFKQTRSFIQIMQRQRANYSQKRCKMLQRLFEIRDELAKQQDESPQKLIAVKYLYELADKKQFIYSELMKTFRKNPQSKAYLPRICQQMNQYIKVLDIQIQTINNTKQKGLLSNKLTQLTPLKQQIKLKQQQPSVFKSMQVQNQFQSFYFDIDSRINCTLKQYSIKSLKSEQVKQMLSFQCPLSYQLKRFQGK